MTVFGTINQGSFCFCKTFSLNILLNLSCLFLRSNRVYFIIEQFFLNLQTNSLQNLDNTSRFAVEFNLGFTKSQFLSNQTVFKDSVSRIRSYISQINHLIDNILMDGYKAKSNREFLMFYRSISNTAKKMKFSIKDSSSKCDQILRKLGIWSYLLKKSVMENFIFCAVKFFLRVIKLTHTQFGSHCTFISLVGVHSLESQVPRMV